MSPNRSFNIISRALIAAIRWYQRMVSPSMPPCCRQIPTCSTYAAQAISRYGVLVGVAKSVQRILQCNPFSYKVFDPI